MKCMAAKTYRSSQGSQAPASPRESRFTTASRFFPSHWIVSLKTSLSSDIRKLSVYSAQPPLGLLSSCGSFHLQVLDTDAASLPSSFSLPSLQTWQRVSPAADLQFRASPANGWCYKRERVSPTVWTALQQKIILRSALNHETDSHVGELRLRHESQSRFL